MTTESERAEMLAKIVSNPSYRLAEEDLALLDEDDLRPLRLQLELIKAAVSTSHFHAWGALNIPTARRGFVSPHRKQSSY